MMWIKKKDWDGICGDLVNLDTKCHGLGLKISNLSRAMNRAEALGAELRKQKDRTAAILRYLNAHVEWDEPRPAECRVVSNDTTEDK